ncbi:hypothetical protein RHGRI_017120 [Rhododendron griersonianum]|uniref:Uncharacterized protein n=1 Tax=Rhododendron griersonianum TaxID=479676 RepID=A0AAV6JWM8_9ERIC|nr:hypothetical protein RHGRI_017120 [Rhododendron griersonianum]
MLCSRTSIKDVHRRRPPNPSSSSSSHPSSPKVTCMGQVNRSNRVTGYPTTATAAAATPIKYHKLIRLFSGKTPTATTTTGRSAEKMVVGRSLSERQMGYIDVSESYAAVNVAELDPPLPVVKRRQQPAAADGNLWKRRSGGCELEGLQLQHIQLPNKRCVLQPITSV